MPEMERKPSRRKRKDFDEENVPMGPAVFTQMGKRAHALKRFIAAMRFLDQAVELDPEGTQSLEPRAAALISLAHYKEALMDIEKLEVLVQRGPQPQQPQQLQLPLSTMQLKAQALWHSGQFERAAVLAAQGMRRRRQPPYFTHMFSTSIGTLEQCVGQSAGECLVELRDHIHALTRKRRKSADKSKARRTHGKDTKTREELRWEERYGEFLRHRRTFLTHLYMGGLVQDWEFVQRLTSNTAMASTINKQSEGRIHQHIQALTSTMTTRLDHLEEECPLYTLRYRAECHTSPQLKERRQEFLEQQQELAAEEAFNCINRILEARERRERKAINNSIASARKFLENVTSKLLPNRHEYMLVLYHLLGVLFLEVKLLRLQSVGTEARQREQRQHVHAILGTSHEVDLAVKDAQMPFVDYLAELRVGERRLKSAKSKLERLVITYEMAYCFAKLGKWENCLNFSRRVATLAKELGYLVWGINAAIALAKAEIHLNTRIEARASMKEAIEMAHQLGDEYVLEMLHAVAAEIEHPTLEDSEEAVNTPEARMVRLMATPELRVECRNLLAHIEAMPPESRLSLHARWKDKQDHGKHRGKQAIALFHKA